MPTKKMKKVLQAELEFFIASKDIQERNKYVKSLELMNLKELELKMESFGLKKGTKEHMKNILILIYDEAKRDGIDIFK